MKRVIYFVLAAALIVGGCKKEEYGTGNIEGTVFNASGEPLRGIKVELTLSANDHWKADFSDISQSSVTGADGRYEFVNLPCARTSKEGERLNYGYKVEVSSYTDSYKSDSQSGDVQCGGTVKCDLMLDI
jgi:hypothetical protein